MRDHPQGPPAAAAVLDRPQEPEEPEEPEGPVAVAPSTYRRLLDLFDQGQVPYRLLDHPPEGQTSRASELRGHRLSAAAKCMVVAVQRPGLTPCHVLAVVPGDRRVDLAGVARECGGRKARFADQADAERLGATVSGTITPFSFHPELAVLADPALFEEPELFFNAARLDRSVAIRAADYRRLARPRVVTIT
ncbi:YbaK/EbsC family protein [Streptomyces tateyamensis]|uniref:YbaK/EbsC family protein n=1 Tax=Streptomyces tateyamensis TaxID=565073 RepID=UPI001FE353E4|nr:YbaK/EbsC family protein [Streptomyces tateyamensis]